MRPVTDYYEEEAQNFAAYERLKDEVKRRYAGQYVAIAEGRLVTVSPDFRTAWNAVCDHKHFLVFPAQEEPRREAIWLRRSRAC